MKISFKSKSTILPILLFTNFLTSCAGSDSANGSKVSSSFVMTSSSKSATVANYKKSILDLFLKTANALTPSLLVDRTGASVSLTQAWIAIKEVEFEQNQTRTSSEVDGTEISFKGPYFVDLLSNAPVTLDTQQVPSTPYQRIKMKLEKNSKIPTNAPSLLANNSIVIQASVGGISFTYLNNDGNEIELGGPKAITPASGQDILVSIQLANLFKQINLSGNITSGLVISSTNRVPGTHLCDGIDTSAADLYTCFRKGFEQQGDFGIDNDKSRDLSSIHNFKVK